jgi:hypothetical protein
MAPAGGVCGVSDLLPHPSTMDRAALEAAHLLFSAELYGRFGAAVVLERFLALGFPLPAGLPAVLRVWRGGDARKPRELRGGLFWTLSRGIACKYALAAEVPAVLAAAVAREDVAAFLDAFFEREVVLRHPPEGAVLDGDLVDWRRGAALAAAASADLWDAAIWAGRLSPLQRRVIEARARAAGLSGLLPWTRP